MKIRRGLLAVLCWSLALPALAALVELKQFDEELAAHGVSADYTDAGMTALLELARSDLVDLRARAEAPDEDDREELAQLAEAVDGALERFAAIAAAADADAKAAAFPALKSMVYSVRSELQGKRKGNKLKVALSVLHNLSLKLPFLTREERARPLAPAEARLEAANLEDPRTGKVYRAPADLAGLTPEQVSQLDVRGDNYLWYAESELHRLTAQHGSAWKALETRIESRVGETLHDAYSLDRARRVLVFERVRSSGTSPKIDARDLYGQEWKLKWGEEVQTEALANRLYVELGGKFEDLVYANKGGRRDLVLVLNAPGGADAAGKPDDCKRVPTFDAFRRCLLESEYKFDVSSNVLEHGVITEELLQQEPFAALPGEKRKLLGREFVTFNESLAEFQTGPGEFRRLGGAPLSSAGALDDRVKRGLVLLCYWIQNKDVKDDNNRGVIDRRSSIYLEYMHDIGASLGSLKISGNPNLLKVGDEYVRRRGDKVRFSANMLYVPKAFDRATYADAAWMGRKILNLSREQILAAVAATRWPDFQQHVVASRLIARRNALAEAFDLGAPLAYDVAPTRVPLGTRAERRAAVARYELAIASGGDADEALARLEGFMQDCGIGLEQGQPAFEDDVSVSVTEGKEERVVATNDCDKSVIVAWLERTLHPAGLARRTYRRTDDKPLDACQPTAKTLGLR
ncbi:MAG TPA: hypothetical protein VJS92_08685 [Candidatus Polarisedimenticolaceae bacterium]|nr:hypothetical protein [Candidatus Polarisedimenticolaceae bacterium]